jgi:putative transposase
MSFSNVLVIIKPETVAAWHTAGFSWFWRLQSRPKKLGLPAIDAEVRALIRRMVKENPMRGAPRIRNELLKLGFDVCEHMVSHYHRRSSPPNRAQEL